MLFKLAVTPLPFICYLIRKKILLNQNIVKPKAIITLPTLALSNLLA